MGNLFFEFSLDNFIDTMEETNAYIIQFQKKQKKEKQKFESKRQSIISLFPHLSQEMDHVFLAKNSWI